jgi:hypothetical protein
LHPRLAKKTLKVMEKYYLHNGTENSGPFDLEELKTRKITKTTPVWCEGMEDWKNAEEIEALQRILVAIPPPIKPMIIEPVTQKGGKKTKNSKILGLSQSTFYTLIGIIILIVAIDIFNTQREKRSEELKQQNYKTEVENHQFELHEKEIEDQKILLIQQEIIEKERISNKNKDLINKRITEIRTLITEKNATLAEKKNKLIEVSDFKLLRTVEERNEQIGSIEEEIEILQTEIDKLKEEKDLLFLEFEKLPKS